MLSARSCQIKFVQARDASPMKAPTEINGWPSVEFAAVFVGDRIQDCVAGACVAKGGGSVAIIFMSYRGRQDVNS